MSRRYETGDAQRHSKLTSTEVGRYWDDNAPAWIAMSRAGADSYRDHLNTPEFLKLLPEVDDLSGLDIGCGDGSNTRAVAALGAKMIGIDISENFVNAARETERRDPRGIDFQVGDGTALMFADSSFDFAVAFMSMMDMPNMDRALIEAHRVVKPGGFFQFSILHPCFVPPHRRNVADDKGIRYAVEIAEYNRRTDGDLEIWTFGDASDAMKARYERFKVPRFHRTLSDWVSMIVAAGFRIEALGEPVADEETAKRVPNVADTRIAPIFLHFLLRK